MWRCEPKSIRPHVSVPRSRPARLIAFINRVIAAQQVHQYGENGDDRRSLMRRHCGKIDKVVRRGRGEYLKQTETTHALTMPYRKEGISNRRDTLMGLGH